MRFARVENLSLRSVALAALFGAAVALTIPDASAQLGEEMHTNHECKDPSSCHDFIFENVPECPKGALCGTGDMGTSFYTCNPGGVIICVNSDKNFGHTKCVGLCDSDGKTKCYYTIYHCKQ